jgi:hypothetical protein
MSDLFVDKFGRIISIEFPHFEAGNISGFRRLNYIPTNRDLPKYHSTVFLNCLLKP